MAELDRMSSSSTPSASPSLSTSQQQLSPTSSSSPTTSSCQTVQSKIISNTGRPRKNRRLGNTNSSPPSKRMKLIKIAPAPSL